MELKGKGLAAPPYHKAILKPIKSKRRKPLHGGKLCLESISQISGHGGPADT
jgi:hypothetical protein